MAQELWDNPLIICGISSLPAPGIRATTLGSYTKTDAHLLLTTVLVTLLAVAILLPLHALALHAWATVGVIFTTAAIIGAELAVARLYMTQRHPS